MFIVKVLMVYVIIVALSWVRAITGKLIFGNTTGIETDSNFKLVLAILFAAMIIREGVW